MIFKFLDIAFPFPNVHLSLFFDNELFNMYECFACIYICVPHRGLMSAEVRRGIQVLGTGIMDGVIYLVVAGTELGSSARANALNH